MSQQQIERDRRFAELWESGPREVARKFATGRESDSSPEILAAMQADSNQRVVLWTKRLAFATFVLAVATVVLGVATLVTNG